MDNYSAATVVRRSGRAISSSCFVYTSNTSRFSQIACERLANHARRAASKTKRLFNPPKCRAILIPQRDVPYLPRDESRRGQKLAEIDLSRHPRRAPCSEDHHGLDPTTISRRLWRILEPAGCLRASARAVEAHHPFRRSARETWLRAPPSRPKDPPADCRAIASPLLERYPSARRERVRRRRGVPHGANRAGAGRQGYA